MYQNIQGFRGSPDKCILSDKMHILHTAKQRFGTLCSNTAITDINYCSNAAEYNTEVAMI